MEKNASCESLSDSIPGLTNTSVSVSQSRSTVQTLFFTLQRGPPRIQSLITCHAEIPAWPWRNPGPGCLKTDDALRSPKSSNPARAGSSMKSYACYYYSLLTRSIINGGF